MQGTKKKAKQSKARYVKVRRFLAMARGRRGCFFYFYFSGQARESIGLPVSMLPRISEEVKANKRRKRKGQRCQGKRESHCRRHQHNRLLQGQAERKERDLSLRNEPRVQESEGEPSKVERPMAKEKKRAKVAVRFRSRIG